MNSRPDRRGLESFVSGYAFDLEIPIHNPRFPEDDPIVPPDARIDAIYSVSGKQMHVEHTSVDLITSGKKRKRELNPGFSILERELSSVPTPAGRAVNVSLSLSDAENIPRLKEAAPALRQALTAYIANVAPNEWNTNRPRSSSISANGITLMVSPNTWRSGGLWMGWSAVGENFVKPEELRISITPLIEDKISKLERSLERSSAAAFGVLVVESDEIAPESFHSFCGVFARIASNRTTRINEIWGYREGSEATLMWFDEIDLGRKDCVYSDNQSPRSVVEIESERMSQWRASRYRFLTTN